MSEYELVPIDPIRKLESEVEELKQYLKSLKEEVKIKTNSSKPEGLEASDSNLIKILIDYAKTNQEIVNSLIKTNIELQSKIAELVVVTNELNKNINRLVEIFKEAALEYMENMKKGKKQENQDVQNIVNVLSEKFESLEKLNLKIIEALENLNKAISELKSKQPLEPIKKPQVRPPFPQIPPQRIPPFPPRP